MKMRTQPLPQLLRTPIRRQLESDLKDIQSEPTASLRRKNCLHDISHFEKFCLKVKMYEVYFKMASENVSEIRGTKRGDCGSVSAGGNKVRRVRRRVQRGDQERITSVFMRLPLELRRKIYKLVLAETFDPLRCSYKVVELEDLFVVNICNRYRDLRQLLLNRQVGYEALEIILARNKVLFYNYLTTTSDRKLRHPEYQPKLMPFDVIRKLELKMCSDHRTTLGFLELCTNLQYLKLHFDIRFESALFIGVTFPIYQRRAEELKMARDISQKWMLFFDLQSLIKATALQTLNISLRTPYIRGFSELINGRVIKDVIKRIKKILPSSVQFPGEKRVGGTSFDRSEFYRYIA